MTAPCAIQDSASLPEFSMPLTHSNNWKWKPDL
jgi:hypothetical protein